MTGPPTRPSTASLSSLSGSADHGWHFQGIQETQAGAPGAFQRTGRGAEPVDFWPCRVPRLLFLVLTSRPGPSEAMTNTITQP